MAKTKAITMEMVKSACKKNNLKPVSITIGEGDKSLKISVKQFLTLAERRDFIDHILQMVFLATEDNKIVYCPHMKKFAFDYNVIVSFTDIKMSDAPEKIWDFLVSTDIAQTIAKTVPDFTIKSLCEAATETIEYTKEQIIKRGKLDNILDGVESIMHALGSKLNESDISSLMEFFNENIPGFQEEMINVIKEQGSEPKNE